MGTAIRIRGSCLFYASQEKEQKHRYPSMTNLNSVLLHLDNAVHLSTHQWINTLIQNSTVHSVVLPTLSCF